MIFRRGSINVYASARELHGDGDDGITAVTAAMGLDFMTDTAVIAGCEIHGMVPLLQIHVTFLSFTEMGMGTIVCGDGWGQEQS